MGIDGGQENLAVAKSNLDLELFQEIFSSIEPNVTIENFEEELGSRRGDNYTSALFRITLNGVVAGKENKKMKWQKQIICKRLPESQARICAYRCDVLFLNEVRFYNKILPSLLEYEKSKTEKRFQCFPQCYLAQSNLLILEDLCAKDFKMPVRQEGLSLQQTERILKDLAQFHALSLSFKIDHPDKFKALISTMEEGIFSPKNIDWYKNYYKGLTNDAVQMVETFMKEHNVERREFYLEKMTRFVKDNFFKTMIELVEFESDLTVICHGDCWVNNFLFLHSGDEDCRIVDFQLIRYSSLTLDIANLLFCCTDHELRQNMKDLIRTYTKELYLALKNHGNTICNRVCGQSEQELEQKIWKDFKKTARFGLGLAMDIVPISTCHSEEAPDLYFNPDGEIVPPELNIQANDLCRRKMSEIVMDLVDNDLI